MSAAIETGRKLALELIKHFESCHLRSYVLKGESWATVGWGHAIPMSQHPKAITQKTADDLLEKDVANREATIARLLKPQALASLSAGQYAATLDFAFNAIPVQFAASSYIRYLNAGNLDAAANELPKWVHGGKSGRQKLNGLVARRQCDRVLFEGGTMETIKAHHFYQS